MKLGIFLDARNPPPWQRPWPDHYRRLVELVGRAEQLGADAAWMTEHHRFEDGYLSQPLTLAAGLATCTSRIRLGTAIVLAALRHPAHLAEEAALVDLLSGGRVELGMGAGYVKADYAAFGVDLDRRFELTDSAFAEVRRLLDGGIVTPPAIQRPFPLWLGYQGPKGARRAGRLGAGLLTLNPASLAPYREGLVEGGYDPGSARMGGVVDLIVADDPEATLERVLPHYAYQLNSYRLAGGGSELSMERIRGKVEGTTVLGLSVQAPQDAIATIRARTDGLPVEHVYLWASVAGMPDDVVDRHLELAFTQVRPALVGPEVPDAG